MKKTRLCTFASSQSEVDSYIKNGATHLIIDNNYYSNRCVNGSNSHEETLQLIQYCNKKYKDIMLSLNLDVIIHNHMINDIESLLIKLNKLNIAYIRFQDLGLLELIKTFCPKIKPCYISETGSNNIHSLKHLCTVGCQSIQFTNELPYYFIKGVQKDLDCETQIQVHGHLLIQHSHRSLLQGINKNKETVYETEDQNFKGRTYQFFQGNHGTLMFNHFDRCLIQEGQKLQNCQLEDWIIDTRLYNINTTNHIIKSYHLLLTNQLSKSQLNEHKTHLESISNKVSKAGFFISNKTDIDWRDEKKKYLKNHRVIADFLDTLKGEYLIMEVQYPSKNIRSLFLQTPEDKKLDYKELKIMNLNDEPLKELSSGDIIKLTWIKGVMPGSKLLEPIEVAQKHDT